MWTDDELRQMTRAALARRISAEKDVFKAAAEKGMGPREIARSFIRTAPDTPECRRIAEMIELGEFDDVFAGALGMM